LALVLVAMVLLRRLPFAFLPLLLLLLLAAGLLAGTLLGSIGGAWQSCWLLLLLKRE
jgi:hypothetical protein